MKVDLDQQLKFSHEITAISLRPDTVMWYTSARMVIMAELTVMWEEGMEAAFERKEKYSELSAACTKAGLKASTYPVEVSFRDFIKKST